MLVGDLLLPRLHWIPHHNTHHYDTIRVLGKTDEKKKLHAKWWITIARIAEIKRS